MAQNKGFKPLKSHIILLPLYSAYRLRCEVEKNTVNAVDLVGYSVGYMVQERIGDLLDGRTHSVGRIYRADDCGPALVSLAVLYANALNVRNCDKILPNFSC